MRIESHLQDMMTVERNMQVIKEGEKMVTQPKSIIVQMLNQKMNGKGQEKIDIIMKDIIIIIIQEI